MARVIRGGDTDQRRYGAAMSAFRAIGGLVISAVLTTMLSFTLTACEDGIEKPSSPTAGSIRPPTWIQGAWDFDGADTSDGAVNSVTYTLAGTSLEFTEDDVIVISESLVGTVRRKLGGSSGTWKQSVTSSVYTLSLSYAGVESTYQWTLSGASRIKFVAWQKSESLEVDPGGSLVYVKT